MFETITIDNEIFNLTHIVSAKFTPAYAGGEPLEDAPGELTEPRPAELEMVLTSVSLEHSYTYDGDVKGTAATNDRRVFVGDIAVVAWDVLNGAVESEE